MTPSHRGLKTDWVAPVAALMASVALTASTASGVVLDVVITGSVEFTDLSRGPFVDAEVGDPVSIRFQIDTNEDIGGGDIHIYETIDYRITVDGVTMTASAVPVFVFSTFSTFHGFENTSTGLLLPGGGSVHNYRVPIFGAAGPPTFWLPQGSEPQDHLGVFRAKLFDTLNINTLVDTDGGGPGIDQELIIAFDNAITIQLPCPGDLDGSGEVGVSDLLILLAAWGTDPGGPPDFDDDGNVGVSDLLFLLGEWGPCNQ